MNLLGGFIAHGLLSQGRIAIVRTAIEDRPGELNQLLAHIAELKINVREMNYLAHDAIAACAAGGSDSHAGDT